ncbi:MAG TPA: hypothetical protein VF816_01350 [Rhodocyclaceae bacterium]
MNPTIAPCPFCRNPAPANPMEVDADAWAIVCPSCGAIGPVGPNEEEARRRWNLRQAPLPGTESR